jgi:hypothetical protein
MNEPQGRHAMFSGTEGKWSRGEVWPCKGRRKERMKDPERALLTLRQVGSGFKFEVLHDREDDAVPE